MKAKFPANREILKKVQRSRRILRQVSDNIGDIRLFPGGSKEAIARAITGNLEKTNRDFTGVKASNSGKRQTPV
jgi:hypothetical protein